MYFVWFDPDTHKPATAIIAEAAARYSQKHGIGPKVCLVSTKLDPHEYANIADVTVIAVPHARPGYFWLAQSEEGDNAPPAHGLPTLETAEGRVIDATRAPIIEPNPAKRGRKRNAA